MKYLRLLLTCTPISELPSHLSTMICNFSGLPLAGAMFGMCLGKGSRKRSSSTRGRTSNEKDIFFESLKTTKSSLGSREGGERLSGLATS